MTACTGRFAAHRLVGGMAALAALGLIVMLVEWRRNGDDRPTDDSRSAPSGTQGTTTTSNQVAPERTPATAPLAVAPPDGTTDRVLCTFLDGVPVETVLLEASTVRTPGMPFAARPRTSRHAIPDREVSADDDVLALCCEGAYVRILHRGQVPPGESRIDLESARSLRIELFNVPAGLQDAVTLTAQVSHESVASAVERLALVSMGVGVMPKAFDGSDSCSVPLFVPRGGELTISAQAKAGGPGYSVKQAFAAGDGVVRVDVSSLAFCTRLGDVAVHLAFPYSYPTGTLRLSWLDARGRCLTHVVLHREAEPDLEVVMRGLRPGHYVPEVHVESDDRTIRLATVEVRSGAQDAQFVVSAQGRLDLFVECESAAALEAAHVVVFDATGKVLGDPGRRGDTPRQFVVDHLPAGDYFVQVLAEEMALASPVVHVQLREADVQQTATTLQSAGAVEVTRRGAVDALATLDLRDAAGVSSRHFVSGPSRRLLCPVGPYEVRVGHQEFPIVVRAGETCPIVVQ